MAYFYLAHHSSFIMVVEEEPSVVGRSSRRTRLSDDARNSPVIFLDPIVVFGVDRVDHGDAQ
jgi:hypothetical protein